MTERNRSRGFSSALAPLMASSPGPVRAERPGEAPGNSGSTFTPAFNPCEPEARNQMHHSISLMHRIPDQLNPNPTCYSRHRIRDATPSQHSQSHQGGPPKMQPP